MNRKASQPFEYIKSLEEKNIRLEAQLDARRQGDMYQCEPLFRQAVDMLYDFLRSGQVSMLELRGAVTLASNRFFMEHERERLFVMAREVDFAPVPKTDSPEKP